MTKEFQMTNDQRIIKNQGPIARPVGVCPHLPGFARIAAGAARRESRTISQRRIGFIRFFSVFCGGGRAEKCGARNSKSSNSSAKAAKRRPLVSLRAGSFIRLRNAVCGLRHLVSPRPVHDPQSFAFFRLLSLRGGEVFLWEGGFTASR